MEQRYLTIAQACEYIGLKPTKAREWLQSVGAKRKIGSRFVRYDKFDIDRAMKGKEEL